MNTGPIEEVKMEDGKISLKDLRQGYHPKLGHTTKSSLFDVLGYVDRDAEKLYVSWLVENGKAKARDNIQSIDIYNGLYDL
jgi:hypothetical protein